MIAALRVLPLTLLLLSASTGMAVAQSSGSGAEEAQLIRSGISLREQGKDQAAFEVFKEAFDRFKTPRAQAQMGLAAQALGRWSDAEVHVRGALASAQDPWVATNRKVLEQALSVIEQRLGSLDVLSNVPGTELSVDGRPVGKLPLAAPLRLAAGTVVVHVQAPGHAPLQRAVSINAGQLSRESFDLVRLESPAAVGAIADSAAPPFVTATVPAAVDDRGRGKAPRVVFFAALGVTALGGGLTVWSGLDTLSARDKFVAAPMRTREMFADGQSRERRTNVLLGMTAALAVGTAVLGLLYTRWSSP